MTHAAPTPAKTAEQVVTTVIIVTVVIVVIGVIVIIVDIVVIVVMVVLVISGVYLRSGLRSKTKCKMVLMYTHSSNPLDSNVPNLLVPPLYKSGFGKCGIVCMPWRGSVSACLAWGDLIVKHTFRKVLKRLSLLRHHGTPAMARPQLPE